MNANRDASIEADEILPGKINYLIGRDARAWRRDVPRYGRIRYRRLYSGIDAVAYTTQTGFEYDFIVSPGANPGEIRLSIAGATHVNVTRSGDLRLRRGAREITMRKPKLYQMTDGLRVAREGAYRRISATQFGFAVGNYKKNAPLIIDPQISLAYTTFLGGAGAEHGNSVAVDANGAVYIGGTTTLDSFPSAATSTQGTASGTSALYVAKIDTTQSGAASLDYLTFIGGSGGDEGGRIAADNSPLPGAAPNLAILGWTTSPDFPVTDGSGLIGTSDLTVSKLNSAGDGFVFSKYFGGSGAEATQNAGGIAVDSLGDVFITSDTNSTDLPMTSPPNGFQANFGGGTSDGLLAEFSSSGSLLYSTYFGINAQTASESLALDSSGNAYIAGTVSNPTSFPARNGFQAAYGGGSSDGFVMEISPKVGANGLLLASFLGGSGTDTARAIAVDSSSPAGIYISGTTQSSDLLTKLAPANAAFQNVLNGTSDAFFIALAQNSGAAPSVKYATYLGGSADDSGAGIAVVSPAEIYFAGSTASADFPGLCTLQSFSGASDGFLAEINPTASGGPSLVYATLLGGSATAEINAIAADADGNAILVGDTLSPDYPLVNLSGSLRGFQPICTSCTSQTPEPDAFIAKISAGTAPAACLAFSQPVAQFGTFATGATSPPIDILVTNDGTANLDVSSVTITGANSGDFSQVGNCVSLSPIAPGGNCDLAVTFAPTAGGKESGLLQVNDDGVGSPQSLILRGTGSTPEVSLAPASLQFGSVLQSTTSATQSVTVTNVGVDTLMFNGVVLGGANSADFAFAGTNDCLSQSVPPNGTCQVTLEFVPKEPNPPMNLSASAQLDFTDVATNVKGSVNIGLSGTETPAAPAVSLLPGALPFGSEDAGSATAAQTIRLQNTGSAPLSISSIAIAGANAGDFSETNDCPISSATLAASANCMISVVFQPTAAGARAATVMVADNASGSPQSVALSGTGIAVGASVSPASLTFGAEDVGSASAAQNVTFSNTGSGPLTISSIGFTGANPGDFQQTSNCPLNGAPLDAGNSCVIAVVFDPQATGNRAASLAIADNVSGSPQTVALSGTAVAPVVQLSPAAFSFSQTLAGTQSAAQPVTLSNTGSGPLIISAAGFSGANASEFAVAGNCVPAAGARVTVAPGANCTATVTFAPASAGQKSANLNFSDNAQGNPQSISISGQASDFQVAAAGASASATITAGQTANFSLQVAPLNGFQGSVALSCTGAPAASSCAVSPASVSVSSSSAAPFSVTVATTSRSVLPVVRFMRIPRFFPLQPAGDYLLLGAFACFLLVLFTLRKVRRRRFALLFPAFAFAALLLVSCGGGGNAGVKDPPGTPPGSYTLTVTGASSGASRSVTLTLTVQ